MLKFKNISVIREDRRLLVEFLPTGNGQEFYTGACFCKKDIFARIRNWIKEEAECIPHICENCGNQHYSSQPLCYECIHNTK